MKKSLFIKRACLSVLFVLFACAAMAQSFTVDDLNYSVNADGVSVTLTGHVGGYENAVGPLNIPESVSYGGNDYTVTTIGNSAFMYYFYLTSLTIPSNVTTIGIDAFRYCAFSGITVDPESPVFDSRDNCNAIIRTETNELVIGCVNTVIPNTVTSIGDYAFRQCSHFTKAVSLATTPPELGNEPGWNCVVFEQFGTQVLTVPYGCAEAYRNSNWYDEFGLNGFYEFIEAEPTAVSKVENVVLAVYPNPTKGVVRIEAEGIQNISVFNTLGEILFETSTNGDAFEYNFSGNEAGVYFIKVETEKGIETKRVTIL